MLNTMQYNQKPELLFRETHRCWLRCSLSIYLTHLSYTCTIVQHCFINI